ncbi:pyridoxamine 5'-phosphate oxidase family protein [Kutzneria albida]|uniref:Pyridoxamine 5'-phosphate oxidase N-terminal domain-containing protein n=1 Tax=Kutzneria albida DSM 43870 TaxID=1449976 RepID=W5WMY9_9PSEU|nr:pyridoxamine 5'-phosphate oxidase family protein [Kutzneria albida]AHH99544.1 hypothetical protein KALB_6184 [Kutzneria albida DSM 43870]
MTSTDPRTQQDLRYGDPAAPPTDWAVARRALAEAELYWLSTVRPDGRPHVTPLVAVLLDGALHLCTGSHERKARNLTQNREVVLTTGSNSWASGLDLVVEGTAEQVTDNARLRRIADAYEQKYGSDWRFEVGDGAFRSSGESEALVFAVPLRTVFGFGKDPHSQTRWRF